MLSSFCNSLSSMINPFYNCIHIAENEINSHSGKSTENSVENSHECCSEFIIPGTFIKGRTLDFPTPLISNLVLHPIGESLSSKDPNRNVSLEWVSKYGFVGITLFGDENNDGNVIEGINTEGLTLSGLTLEATTYQSVPEGEMNKAMALSDVFVWLLGTCATIGDVEEALSSVYLWGDPVSPLPLPPKLHFSIHDKSGKSFVIEYIDGKLKSYENPLGMLTNDPTFPEQLENFYQYDYLTTGFAEGSTYPGSGMIGLPGDWSSPSRFVRGGKLLENVKIEKGCEIQTAMQILGSVEVIKGIKLAFKHLDIDYDSTHWKTITDIANLQLFYQTINSREWYQVDLNQLNFNGSKCSIPIYHPKQDRDPNTKWAIPMNDQLNKNYSLKSRLFGIFG